MKITNIFNTPRGRSSIATHEIAVTRKSKTPQSESILDGINLYLKLFCAFPLHAREKTFCIKDL